MPEIIPSEILVQKSFIEDLKKLLTLTPEQIRAVAKWLDSAEFVPLAAIVGVDAEQARRSILPIAAFLYNLARTDNATSEEVVDELQSIGAEHGVAMSQQQLSAFRTLFDPKLLLDKRDSIQAVKGCVLPTLDSVKTTQELRNVNDIRSQESLGVTPVITLGLKISYPNGDDRSISIELDDESLRVLSEALEEADQKLRKMKEQVSNVLKILE